MSGLLQLFVCKPLSTKLTRKACAAKHKLCRTGSSHFARRLKTGEHVNENGVFGTACRTCVIGAAHLRGEEPAAWPDGSPIETAEITPGMSRWLGDKTSSHQGIDSSAVPTAEQSGEAAEGEPSVSARTDAGAGAANQPATSTAAPRSAWSVYVPDDVPEAPTAKAEGAMGAAGTGRTIKWKGRELTSTFWAREADIVALGITRDTIDYRRRQGWSPEKIFTTPPGAGGPKKRARTDAIAPPPSARVARAKEAPKNDTRRVMEAIASIGQAGPLEILLAAGYEASSVEVPAGLLIVVKR